MQGTDWASLEHAYGSAEEASSVLGGLLAADPSSQARAMRYLEDPVHHQNSIYSATAPAALYVAAALRDPRTATMLPSREHGEYQLRAAMLDWLQSVANAVGDDAEAIRKRLGFPLERHPASVQVQTLRPALFRAVSPVLQDPEPAVREAAIATAVSLLDAPELVQHRAAPIPPAREVMTVSAKRSYRFIAVRGLRAWGEDTCVTIPEGTSIGIRLCGLDAMITS